MMWFTKSMVLGGVLTFLLPWDAPATSFATEKPGEPSQNQLAELKALQKERIETLTQLAKILEAQYRAGHINLRRLATVEMELLDAKVEAAESPEERTARLEELLAKAKEVLGFAETRYRAGFHVTQADVLEAKSLYLDIKIRLTRERAKAAKKP